MIINTFAKTATMGTEMEYEFLMRSIYDCGRDYKIGADADIYRDMDYAEAVIDDPLWGKSKSEKEYDFRIKFSKVRNYVRDAISNGIKKIRPDETELKELQSMVSTLDFRSYNRKELDTIIVRAGEIFSKHGLKA